EADDVILMAMGDDDEGQLVAGLLGHVGHGVLDRADVALLRGAAGDAAVDEDVLRPGSAGDGHQEKVAEADAVHPDAQLAFAVALLFRGHLTLLRAPMRNSP